MGFVYIPGPFIEVDPAALKKNGTNSPTATMNWGDQDLVGVKKLGIGVSSVGTHAFLWIANSPAVDEHPNIDIESVTANRQPGVRFRVDSLTTPGYAIGGIRAFWDGDQVARVDLVRSDDAGADGPGGLQDEGYISFTVKKTTKTRKVVLKLDETGSLVFQNEADYDTNLLWAGSGDIGDGAGQDPTNIFFTGNLNGIAAADFVTLTDGSNADSLHVHAAAGDVVGPGSSTDNAVARFDSTTGKLIQDSGVVIDDSDNLSGVANLDITGQMASAHDTETQAASTAHTIDWNDGNSTTWDLQAANGTPIVLTLSNPKAGASYIIEIIQGSAIRNVTWPGTVKWPGGTAPTISTTNDDIDIISLFYDGTNYFGTFNQDFS